MNNSLLNKNPLFDEEFLNELFNHSQREIYARISLLTINEEPLEQIEGKITDGSINIDGSSAVRRTCNLNMVAEDVNINEFYWGLNSKFKLEVGLRNFINPLYPDIIWFKQGLFIITQFNTSQSTNQWTIKIQGKDKMCLLNGEVSGKLPPTDFAREQYTDLATGNISFTELPIKTIIQKLLQEFALEQPHNIIINDIDEIGQELLEYRGETPLYLLKNISTDSFDQMTINADLECYYQLKEELTIEEYYSIPNKYNSLKEVYYREDDIYKLNKSIMNTVLKDYLLYDWFKGTVSDSFMITYDDLLDDEEFKGGKQATAIRFARNGQLNNEIFTLVKIEYGSIPGYKLTDLVYPGELKSSAGETITSILDKIKNKFTNFEYFYDVDGKFIFQKKKDYIITSWNSEQEGNSLYTNAGINNENTMFTFSDGTLITNFQNTPKLLNLKNDYSVHGNRDNMAIRMRYAIDNKPTSYKPIRTLKEVTMTISWNKNKELDTIEKVNKYYDAPEVEPYNDIGLIGADTAYQILERIENGSKIFTILEINELKEKINIDEVGNEFYHYWFNLFQLNPDDPYHLQYLWHGTMDDLKAMIIAIVNYESVNDVKSQLSIIPDLDGGETWILICPYFANYEYSTKHIAINNQTKEIITTDNLEDILITNDKNEKLFTIIHYKVDWRELIYQMSLDYRKLNLTDNYRYYLRESNPQFTSGKTGYEQYYIDMSLWRDLYNPNPELLFNELINFKDVQKFSLLLDDDQTNDKKDLIYIKDGYSLIDKKDKDNINYMNTYVYSAPSDTGIKSLYPYYISAECALNQQGTKYYLENDITKKIEIAYKTQGNKIIADYDKLAYSLPNKIYIKNDQLLETDEDKVFTVKLTENNENSDYNNFTVLEYPISPAFEKTYGNDMISNYIVFAETRFEETKNNLEKFYSHNTGYSKLDKQNILWPLYYHSNLYSLSYKSSDIINSLNQLVNIMLNFKTNSIAFNKNVVDILKNYIIYLNNYDYDDIKETLYNIIKDEFDAYYNTILSYVENKNNYNENISCLYYIFSSLEKTLISNVNVNKLNESKNLNEKLLYLLTLYSNLNLCVQTTLTSIEANYNQVNFIPTNAELKTALKFEPNSTNFEDQWTQINNIKTELENAQNTLNTINQLYKNGQAQKTQTEISRVLNIIIAIQNEIPTINDVNNNTEILQGKFTEIKNLIENNILNIINELNTTSTLIHHFILQICIWTPDVEKYQSPIVTIDEYNEYYKEQYSDKFIEVTDQSGTVIEYKFKKTDDLSELQTLRIQIQQQENILYKFLSQIKLLKTLFTKTTQADIINLLNFNNSIFFKDELYNLIIEENADIEAILKQFELLTSDFQEYIVRENVNNFNQVNNSDIITYEPIKYYKASYAFNHDEINGNYWLLDIFDNPQLLTFWIDFLEPISAEMAKYSVPAIGIRSTVINDKDVKSVHYKDIPTVIFKNPSQNDYNEISGYTYINLTSGFTNLFAISSKGKTAKERIEELLYYHSYCTENVNISTIPVYNLEPNYKIYIRDDKCNINGEYIINKITVPLNYKKMMSITATKAVADII